MKRTAFVAVGALLVLIWSPIKLSLAQTTVKTLSQVPITYPGDTDETIKRRAQWIEGAKKEGGLDWWGTLVTTNAMAMIAEFNKVYPFIKVSWYRGTGEEIATKLEAEYMAGRRTSDVVHGGEERNYPRWRERGMMQKFTDIIPRTEKMDRRMYGVYGDSAMPGHTVVAPLYNTKLVSATEVPKTWEDLLSPKWRGKGQLAQAPDMKWWANLALAEGGWGVAKTEDFLAKLRKQDLTWAPSFGTALTLLIAGDFKVAAQGYLHQMFLSQEQKAAVEWARVSPVIVGGSNTIWVKGPHPNAARLFLEWLYSPQGLAAFEQHEKKGIAFPGSGSKLSKLLQGLDLVVQTDEVTMKMIELGLDQRFSEILAPK